MIFADEGYDRLGAMLLMKFQSNSGRNGVEDSRLFLLIGLGHTFELQARPLSIGVK